MLTRGACGFVRVFSGDMAFERRRIGEVVVAVLALLHGCTSVAGRSHIVNRGWMRPCSEPDFALEGWLFNRGQEGCVTADWLSIRSRSPADLFVRVNIALILVRSVDTGSL